MKTFSTRQKKRATYRFIKHLVQSLKRFAYRLSTNSINLYSQINLLVPYILKNSTSNFALAILECGILSPSAIDQSSVEKVISMYLSKTTDLIGMFDVTEHFGKCINSNDIIKIEEQIVSLERQFEELSVIYEHYVNWYGKYDVIMSSLPISKSFSINAKMFIERCKFYIKEIRTIINYMEL